MQAVQPTGFKVLRAYTAGVVTDTAIVTTTAGTKTVGSTTPTPLPWWDFDTSTVLNGGSTNFTFLTSDNEAEVVIEDGSGDPVVAATVQLTRCLTSAGSTATPVAGTCTTSFPGFLLTVATDAAGAYSFTGLEEGVYEVVPIAASTPTAYLFQLSGPTDVDKGDFTQP